MRQENVRTLKKTVRYSLFTIIIFVGLYSVVFLPIRTLEDAANLPHPARDATLLTVAVVMAIGLAYGVMEILQWTRKP